MATKLVSAALGLLVLTAAYSPAFAASGGAPIQGTQAAPVSGDQSLFGMITPIFANSVEHQTAKTCKPDTLYGKHDVVGDPDVCTINRINAGVSVGSIVSVGGL